MSTDVITALIIFSGVAAMICVRARAAGPALLFGVFSLVLLAATPAGEALGELVSIVVDLGEGIASLVGGS